MNALQERGKEPSPNTTRASRAQRLGAAGAAIPLGLFVASIGTPAAILIAFMTQVPNAYDSGLDYTAAPDTWAGTFKGVAISVPIVLVVMVMLTGLGALVGFAASGRWPSVSTLLIAPSALTAGAMALILGALLLMSPTAELRPNCDAFRFDRAAFASALRERWEPQTRGLGDCNVIEGLNRAQIEAKLGPADEDEYTSLRYHDKAFVIDFKELDPEGRPVSVWAW